MAGLKKVDFDEAKRMRGTTNKNLMARAWKIRKAKESKRKKPSGKKSTTPRTGKASPSPKGGRRMAKQKQISLSNLAGAATSAELIGIRQVAQQAMEGNFGDIPGEIARNLTNRDHLAKHVPPLIGIAIVKMLVGNRQVGRLGPISIRA